MRCPVHLSIGQEVNAVLISMFLSDKDYMVSTHRSHAHFLAKGGKIKALIGELYGKSSGCSRGFGGSMHLCDTSVGFLGSTSIVSGTVPVGVGAGFSIKLKGETKVSVVCLGDAALEEGVVHEAVNFARLHSLPVVFFCENNYYSCYTHIKDRKPNGELNLPRVNYIRLPKYDYVSCYNILEREIYKVRERHEPIFIEMETYRFLEHCGPNNDNHLKYRPEAEIKGHQDPIKVMENQLLKDFSIVEEYIYDLKNKIKKEVESIFEDVKRDPFPNLEELGKYTYA